MLTLALVATLVGFVLLVVGLITGTLWLALACIGVCLVGMIFLVADIVWSGRRGKPDEDVGGGFGFGDSQPAGSDHADMVDGDASDGAPVSRGAQGRSRAGAAGPGSAAESAGEDVIQFPEDERQALWEGVISPSSSRSSGREQGESAPTQSHHPPAFPGPGEPSAPSTAQRGYADYLRSVGASGSARTPSEGLPTFGPDQSSSHPPTSTPGSYGQGRSRHSARPDDPQEKVDPLHPDWRPPPE